jgi:hypothetical protein
MDRHTHVNFPKGKGTLAAAIDSDDTTITLGTGQGANFPTGICYIRIDLEFIEITSRTGDVFTVANRGVCGSTAAAHAINAAVANDVVDEVFAEIVAAITAIISGSQVVADSTMTGDILDSGANEHNIFNTGSLTVNIGGEATSMTLGALGGFVFLSQVVLRGNMSPGMFFNAAGGDATRKRFYIKYVPAASDDASELQFYPVTDDGTTVGPLVASLDRLGNLYLASAIRAPNLPTSDPHVAGKLWVDSAAGYAVKQSQG